MPPCGPCRLQPKQRQAAERTAWQAISRWVARVSGTRPRGVEGDRYSFKLEGGGSQGHDGVADPPDPPRFPVRACQCSERR